MVGVMLLVGDSGVLVRVNSRVNGEDYFFVVWD